jgi:ABC-type multidrug transport system ATPase subunit
MHILQVNDLSKSYGRIRALDGFSLMIEKGSTFGILGPNGSGKTTLLSILLEIVKPNDGTFQWNFSNGALDPKKEIGALLETPNFYPYLNAVDNLLITAKIKGKGSEKIDSLIDMVGLGKRRKTPFKAYSLGMKQRLAIAAAMVGDPEVLIFDEPGNGLDPEGIAEIRDLIQQIAQSGRTIIMASHILDEVEKICSHVAIIREGQLLHTGTVGEILLNDRKIIELKAGDMTMLMGALQEMQGLESIHLQGQFIWASAEKSLNLAELNAYLMNRGITLSQLREVPRRLEDEFLQIVRNNN